MPKADSHTTASRRSFLGGLTAVTASAGGIATGESAPALSAPPDDAELMALCVLFGVRERQVRALYDGPVSIADDAACEAAAAALRARQAPLLDRLCALRATTPAGIRARAAMAAQCWPERLSEAEAQAGFWSDRALIALVRDIVDAGDVA